MPKLDKQFILKGPCPIELEAELQHLTSDEKAVIYVVMQKDLKFKEAMTNKKEDKEILNASIPSANVAVKPHIRESRLRKRDKRYKDFVVDLGETEQLAVHENTTPTKDDTNEDIENIPNNNRNQQVRNVGCNECFTICFLSGIYKLVSITSVT